MQRLRDLGNTVIIVEHDEAIMRAADYIVERLGKPISNYWTTRWGQEYSTPAGAIFRSA